MAEFYDVVATILTFLTFAVMFFGLAIVILIKDIEKNWPKYKCNPAIIPFVGLIGKDGAANFNSCIGDIQGQYMNFFLAPLTRALGTLSNVGTGLVNSLENIRNTINFLSGGIFNILQSLKNIINAITREFQILLIKFRNIILKIVGVFLTLVYTVMGTGIFVTSVVAGPIGRMVDFIGSFGG